MAHHKSAKKRIRSNGAKQIRNSSYYSSVKTAVKKFKTALESGTGEGLPALFSSAQSLLDRAAKRGIIHKNNASRRVNRLSAMLAKFQASSAAK